MPAIIEYILKLNICLSIVYLFYQLFLRRLTFYNWNRWYLLGYTVLSFLIPFIDVMPSLQRNDLLEMEAIQWIPAISFSKGEAQNFFETLTYWDWAMAGFLLVSLALLARLALRFYALKKMKARARLISGGDTKIYQLDDSITPFSFGNAIFINRNMHESEELENIIKHEFVHVKQRHTIDILWSEWLCIVNWFNPFAWMLRHNMKQNLEFIADNKVLQNGLDKKEYQYLLLKVMGNRYFAFTNHFNLSSLKKRIVMMNTIKSAKVHLIKFLFLLPVVAVLLLSFRKEVIKLQEQQQVLNKPEQPLSGKEKVEEPHVSLVVAGNGTDTVPAEKQQTPAIAIRQPNSSKLPLIVVDGVEMEKGYTINKIDPQSIKSISVLKDAAAVSLYGDKGADGVIQVTTKENKSQSAPSLQLRGIEGKKPLYVLNGKPIENRDLLGIHPDDIESIAVVKDAAAKSVYGSRAEEGVVFIATKNGLKRDSISFSSNEDKIIFRKAENGHMDEIEANKITVKDDTKTILASGDVNGSFSGFSMTADTLVYNSSAKQDAVAVGYGSTKRLQLQGKTAGTKVLPNPNEEVIVRGYPLSKAKKNIRSQLPANAYYVLNGKKAKKKDIDKLAPNTIQSIDVLKGESAVKYYGPKAKDGAIIITTE